MVRDVSTETQRIIRDNWPRVQDEVARACQAAGRDPAEVTIVGVAKYVGPELTAQLVTAGCPLIGENRPQALWDKHAWFAAQGPQRVPMPQWHLIGHLQRNKVRRTLPLVTLIQSVDSLRLIEELGLEADRQQSAVRLLLDVNVTRDASKTGLPANQLSQAAEAILERPRLQLCGLMAMSPGGGRSHGASRVCPSPPIARPIASPLSVTGGASRAVDGDERRFSRSDRRGIHLRENWFASLDLGCVICASASANPRFAVGAQPLGCLNLSSLEFSL